MGRKNRRLDDAILAGMTAPTPGPDTMYVVGDANPPDWIEHAHFRQTMRTKGGGDMRNPTNTRRNKQDWYHTKGQGFASKGNRVIHKGTES